MKHEEIESSQVIINKVSDKGEKIVAEIKKMLNLKDESLHTNGNQVFNSGHSDHTDHMDCGNTYGGSIKQKENENENNLFHSKIIGNMQLEIKKGKFYNSDDHSDYTDHSDYGDYGD